MRECEWCHDQQQAFDLIKKILCEAPVLTTPDQQQPFILDTDASDEGLVAVLAQDSPDGERIMAYYSRCFTKPERNYCVILCIQTDHAALKWLLFFLGTGGPSRPLD